MGRASRDKGKRGERAVVNLFKAHGMDVRRLGNAGGLADVIGVEGCHIEVKSAGTLRVAEWMRQAETEAQPTEIPVLIWRLCRVGKSTPWYACLPADEFAAMLRRSTT